METKRLGSQTVALPARPLWRAMPAWWAKKRATARSRPSSTTLSRTTVLARRAGEKAESAMQRLALSMALNKAELAAPALDYIFAGDLLNQCIGTGFACVDRTSPSTGLYGACSTMAESLSLAALMIDGGFARHAAALTSSHFCSAERQYRTPLEYGGQRTPTAQWTVTGSGCTILAAQGDGPRVTHVTTGKIADKGIKDANNMGAAMAPAAYETIKAHLQDTGRKPSCYDLILTGDLGKLGRDIVEDLFRRDGVELSNLADCGTMIYDLEGQDVHCGGSGCGCSAVVLNGYLMDGLKRGRWKRLLFCGTGALLSPTSTQQGESIPAICHAVALAAPGCETV